MKNPIVVISTFPNRNSSQVVARSLVKKRLAACCNCFPVESSFVWQGKFEVTKEVMMLIKTTHKKYKAIEALLRKKHPYELPEIIVCRIIGGERNYLNWLMKGVDPVRSSTRHKLLRAAPRGRDFPTGRK